MVFALAHMASLQHCVCIGTGLFSVDRIDRQRFRLILDLCAGDTLDSLDAHRFDLLDIKLSFASHTDDICFLAVYAVLFHQFLEAVCISGL